VSATKRANAHLAKLPSELDLHVTPAQAKPYLGRYSNAELGPLTIAIDDGKLMARAPSYWAELAPKLNKNASTSLITISPGLIGLDFLVSKRNGKSAIALNDGQHE
jgi:hypothetical protein